MNDTIAKIVNMLFADIMETEETRALWEELNQNCQERYQDLIQNGLSEDDAIHAVLESLSGMEDALKDYPRKSSQTSQMMGSSHYVFSGEFPQTVDIRAKSSDVRLCRSPDGQLHVDSDDEDAPLNVTLKNGCLTVQPASLSRQGGSLMERLFSGELFLLGGVPSILFIQLPADCQPQVQATTFSGDIEVDGLSLKSLTLHSTSGDIRCDDVQAQEGVRLESTSGDISFQGDCQTLNTSSISGDLRTEARCPDQTCKSTSGDIAAVLPRLDALCLNAKSTSGNVRVSLPEGMAADAHCSTISGDVRCQVPLQPGSPYQLEMSSITGDLVLR